MSNVNQQASTVGEAYWDKHGIPIVSLAEGLKQIELSIKAGQNRGVWCLISESGVGKSQGVKQVLRKAGYEWCDIRTAQLTHVGAGVPQKAVDGYFEYAVPANFPRKGEKKAVLFDEVNQGQPHAIALMYMMLEDRGLYGYELPDTAPVILMMNPSTALYMVSKIESNPAINRRLKKLYLVSDFADWKEHARTNEFHHSDGMEKPCHPLVVRYLTSDPRLLYIGKERDAGKQFACPATWQTVSLDLYVMEVEGIPLGSDFAMHRIGASINTVQAKAFIEWVRNNEIKLDPMDVLLKYKAKSAIRSRVRELQQEPGGSYNSLVETISGFLFDEEPEPEQIAPQLVLFWYDMPNETAQAFYQMLATDAQRKGGESETDNIEYMKRLTIALQGEELWDDLNDRINRAHDSFERDLKGTGQGFDPMY